MLEALTHGWNGVGLVYASVEVPMLVGLIQQRAGFRKILESTFLAVPLGLAADIGISLLSPLTRAAGATADGALEFGMVIGVCASVGYAGARFVARKASARGAHRRGAVISEPPLRSRGRQADSRQATLDQSRDARITLAGVPVAARTRRSTSS